MGGGEPGLVSFVAAAARDCGARGPGGPTSRPRRSPEARLSAQLSVEFPTSGGSLDHGNEIHSLVRFHT
jgi:hypothetical protein